MPTVPEARFNKARNGIALLLLAIAALLFLVQFLAWREALPMPDSKVLSVIEQRAAYRPGMNQLYETRVSHSDQVFTGVFRSAWCVGRPNQDEVVDLRRSGDDGSVRFHFDQWTREFSAWFVLLAVGAILTPVYLALFRSLERYHQRIGR